MMVCLSDFCRIFLSFINFELVTSVFVISGFCRDLSGGFAKFWNQAGIFQALSFLFSLSFSFTNLIFLDFSQKLSFYPTAVHSKMVCANIDELSVQNVVESVVVSMSSPSRHVPCIPQNVWKVFERDIHQNSILHLMVYRRWWCQPWNSSCENWASVVLFESLRIWITKRGWDL